MGNTLQHHRVKSNPLFPTGFVFFPCPSKSSNVKLELTSLGSLMLSNSSSPVALLSCRAGSLFPKISNGSYPFLAPGPCSFAPGPCMVFLVSLGLVNLRELVFFVPFSAFIKPLTWDYSLGSL